MTLSALPTEVLYRIIDSFLLYPQRHPGNCWLDLDDRLDVDVRANRQSLIALSVVNKRIGNVARNALWHAITLPYLSERTVSTLNPMTSNSMEIQWQRNLDLTIAANPARASVTQALYLRQISDAGRLESTLSPFVNLRLLHLDCIHLSASVSRVLSDIFQSLDRLRNFVFDCSEVPAERVFELLSMLPTSRTYDGVRFLDITFPKECSLVVRIRSLFIDGDCSDDSQLHIDFLEKLDRSVLEDLTLQLGIDRPADSIERILSLGWPALTRLAIKGDEYEGLPTGWARPEDRPKLRTLELEGIRPKPEYESATMTTRYHLSSTSFLRCQRQSGICISTTSVSAIPWELQHCSDSCDSQNGPYATSGSYVSLLRS